MSDTRQMRRARAKAEYKKMQKSKTLGKVVTFPAFFDFYMKNLSVFEKAAAVQAEVTRRKGAISVKDAARQTTDLIEEIDDSFLMFEDDEEGTDVTQDQ